VLGAYLGLPETEETASIQEKIKNMLNLKESVVEKLKNGK
jgi:hypothetical protein